MKFALPIRKMQFVSCPCGASLFEIMPSTRLGSSSIYFMSLGLHANWIILSRMNILLSSLCFFYRRACVYVVTSVLPRALNCPGNCLIIKPAGQTSARSDCGKKSHLFLVVAFAVLCFTQPNRPCESDKRSEPSRGRVEANKKRTKN